MSFLDDLEGRREVGADPVFFIYEMRKALNLNKKTAWVQHFDFFISYRYQFSSIIVQLVERRREGENILLLLLLLYKVCDGGDTEGRKSCKTQ